MSQAQQDTAIFKQLTQEKEVIFVKSDIYIITEWQTLQENKKVIVFPVVDFLFVKTFRGKREGEKINLKRDQCNIIWQFVGRSSQREGRYVLSCPLHSILC